MSEPLYLVTYQEIGHREPISLRVREISDSGLGPMFVKLARFDFEPAGRIVDPRIESLRSKFEKTKSLHVNRMMIVSVEEIDGPEVKLEPAQNLVLLRPPT